MTRPGLAPVGSARRAAQAAVVALLAVAGSLVWSPNASAATVPIALDANYQAWYWSSNKEVRQCVGTEDQGLCQVVDGAGASPVEPGHLAVALQTGASDMRTYVRPNFFPDAGPVFPEGSTVTSMILTLPVSRADATDTEHTQHHAGPGAKAPSTQSEEKAAITACVVAIDWGNAEAAPPYTMNKKDPTKTIAVEPFVRDGGVDCNKFSVQGKRGAKAWTFDLSKIAAQWVAGTYENNGVVLLPNITSGTDSWRVEFHGAAVTVQNNELEQIYVSAKEAGNLRAVYTPPNEPPPPPPPPPPPGVGGGFIPPPVVEPPVIAPEPAPTSTNEPVPAQTQQPDVEQVGAQRPSTPWYVWAVLPFALAGFVAFSRAVGHEAGQAGMNRVAQVLRARHATAPSGD